MWFTEEWFPISEELSESKAFRYSMSERIKWIDSLKGFTIILVVIGHSIGGYVSSHTFEVDYRHYEFIYDLIYSFHMPLTMLLSGYVFNIAYGGCKFKKKKSSCTRSRFLCAISAVKHFYGSNKNVECRNS